MKKVGRVQNMASFRFSDFNYGGRVFYAMVCLVHGGILMEMGI